MEGRMSFRNDMLRCLGTLPDIVEPKPAILISRDKGNHMVHLIQYEVETGESVTAYLLVPKDDKPKYPAIIASHQHNHEYNLGKSEPAGLAGNPMYHYGLDLCLRGFVVLCPDHLGFEDRRPTEPMRAANVNLDGERYERLLFCRYLLIGSSLQAKYVSDLSRAVDVLQSLSFVDAGRIGAIGHSLGGQETLWLMWHDQRIKAAVSSCGFSRIQDIMEAGINHNFAMFCPGFLKTGDVEDLVCALAPRPFMMTSGMKDPIYPLKGTKKIEEAAREAYSKAGMLDNFNALFFDGSHAFPADIKEQAYTWLDKFLK
jgi:dienelactone hydrolase